MLDLSKLKLMDECYNGDSCMVKILDDAHEEFFSKIMQLILLETGTRQAREKWQLQQLNNLLDHVSQKSVFWRNRIPYNHLDSLDELRIFPILERKDVKEQVETEGPLVDLDPEFIVTHYTSGSSGIPIKFYYTKENDWINSYRVFARQFMANYDFSQNAIFLFASSEMSEPGFKTEYGVGIGSLGFIETGVRRIVSYANPDLLKFKEEIKKYPIGYLTVNPYMMETLNQVYTFEEMKADGLKAWIPIGGAATDLQRKQCKENDIRLISNYSSEEISLIGYECNHHPGHYHVAGSNVIVECIPEEGLTMHGNQMGRILVTKMHSYATPFIRYDIGDIGELLDKCPCGHDGPTIRHLHGRAKNLIKKKDGSVFSFLIQVKNHPFIANYKEFRFIQTDLETIRIQIGGVQSLTQEEIEQWAGVVYDQVGRDEFKIEIELLDQIDWGGSKKKIPFKSLVI